MPLNGCIYDSFINVSQNWHKISQVIYKVRQVVQHVPLSSISINLYRSQDIFIWQWYPMTDLASHWSRVTSFSALSTYRIKAKRRETYTPLWRMAFHLFEPEGNEKQSGKKESYVRASFSRSVPLSSASSRSCCLRRSFSASGTVMPSKMICFICRTNIACQNHFLLPQYQTFQWCPWASNW